MDGTAALLQAELGLHDVRRGAGGRQEGKERRFFGANLKLADGWMGRWMGLNESCENNTRFTKTLISSDYGAAIGKITVPPTVSLIPRSTTEMHNQVLVEVDSYSHYTNHSPCLVPWHSNTSSHSNTHILLAARLRTEWRPCINASSYWT